MFSLSMRLPRVAAARGGLVGVVLLAGCNALPSVVPVSGTVTYHGKPVEGATVTFSRGNGDRTKGDVAVGTTDASGRYELTTHFTGKAKRARRGTRRVQGYDFESRAADGYDPGTISISR